MTDSTLSNPDSHTHREVVGLLREGLGSPPEIADGGYLDAFGEAPPIFAGGSQPASLSRAIAVFYERIWRPTVARVFFFGRGVNAAEERGIVLSMLGLSPGERVIDVGCGPGNYTRDLAQGAVGGLVVGVDAWEPMLTAAVERGGGGASLAYVRGDACALPFRDGSFDAACSVGVIHMVDDPFAALAEMVRVLVPGGRLVVMVTCTAKPGARSLRKRLGLKVFGHDEVTGFFTAQGLGEIEQRVVKQGQFVAARKPVD